MATPPPCAGDLQLDHALGADLRPERRGEAHALALQVRRERRRVEQVEQPHDLQRPPLRSPAPRWPGAVAHDVGQGQPEQVAVGIGDADARHLLARQRPGPGRLGRAGDRERHAAGATARPAGRAGAWVLRAGSNRPAASSPRQVLARELEHHAPAHTWPARPAGAAARWPVARTARMQESSNRSLPDDSPQLRRFKRAVVVDLDHAPRADQAGQLGVVQQAGGRVPVLLDGVVDLRWRIRRPGRSRSEVPSTDPSVDPSSAPPWPRWPAPGPARSARCRSLEISLSSGLGASLGGGGAGGRLGILGQLDHRLGRRWAAGGCTIRGSQNFSRGLPNFTVLVTIRSRTASGRGADLRCDWYTSNSQRPVDGQR